MADTAAVKIADFGFARQICGEKELTTPCFTLYYAAPEVLSQVSNLTSKGKEEKHGYDESCDLWSLGVILVNKVQCLLNGCSGNYMSAVTNV